MVSDTLTAERVREALAAVPDPEIPTISIADLGMVEDVRVTDAAVEVVLLPTFVGCPAQFVIREDAEKAVAAVAGAREVRVRFVFDPPWTTDRITPKGHEALAAFGVAPPGAGRPAPLLQIAVPCPYCGSRDTRVEADFGPTPCRTVRYCDACRNPFEAFKPKPAAP